MRKSGSRIVQALRAPLVLALSASVVGVATSAWMVNELVPLNVFNGDLADLNARNVRPLSADPSIVLVLVDEDTPSALGRPKSSDLPLKLTDYARLITVLSAARPSVILLDIDVGSNAANKNQEGQQAMLLATSKLDGTRLVVPAAALIDASLDEPKPNPDAVGGFDYKFTDPSFAKGSGGKAHVGHALSLKPNIFDIGVNPVLYRLGSGQTLPHVALLSALLHRNCRVDNLVLDVGSGRLVSDLGPWGLNSGLGLDTLWTAHWNDFPRTSFQECLSLSPEALKSKFQGRVVVIGDIRAGMDESAHPAKFAEVPGVSFVANTLNTFLRGPSEWPRNAGEPIVLGLSFVLCLFAGFALTQRAGWWRLFAPLALATMAMALPSALVLLSNTFVDPLVPVLSVLVTSAIVGSLIVLRSGWFESRVAGSLQECAVLFVDLRDSTNLTVTLGAQSYQRAFTEFAVKCSSLVHSHGGAVERTTGDGLIATFPAGKGSHATVRAVECAKEVVSVAEASADGLDANIGIEFGLVSGGYVVEAGRSVWSSSGKTVILAQRLLSVAGESRRSIVVGPVAARFLSETERLESLGTHSLKGIAEKTEVFALG